MALLSIVCGVAFGLWLLVVFLVEVVVGQEEELRQLQDEVDELRKWRRLFE